MRSSSRHSSAHDPAAPAIFVAVPRDHVAMLGDCASVATLRHDRFSERSYLFTMSNITPAHQASRPDGAGKRRSLRTSSRLGWWSQTESNRRPPACKAGALPTELWPLQTSGIRSQHSGRACTPMSIPDPGKWWAWEDLNFRPHAYQARALTN